MRLRGVAAGAALALALALAHPLLAQTPLGALDEHDAKRLDRMEQAIRELRAIVFQGRDTGKPVVVQPADADAQLSALEQKIDDLSQAVTRLTGELESAGHDVDSARREADQLREENGALAARVTALEQKLAASTAAAVAPAPVSAAAPPPPPPLLDAAAALAAAKEAMNAGDLTAAESGFHDVVNRFGDTPRGAEGRYYLAKLMIRRQAFADAAAMDLQVVRSWPATAWAPDAALDLARAMIGMNQPAEACGVLAQIDVHYPKARAEVRTGEAELRSQSSCQTG